MIIKYDKMLAVPLIFDFTLYKSTTFYFDVMYGSLDFIILDMRSLC